jgi:outer membrane protein assembly factor BamA
LLFLDYSRTTKNNQFIRLFYESDKLIPEVRTMIDLAFIDDRRYDFLGFNGYESVYHRDIDKGDRDFYAYRREKFRVRADFQGKFPVKNLYWLLGYEYLNFKIKNSGVSDTAEPSLYDNYVAWGLIPNANAKGGNSHSLKAGVMYDSRNVRLLPGKGIFSEFILQAAPRFLFNENNAYWEMVLTHRQYIPLTQHITLAYRASYQSTLGNDGKPFYAKPPLLGSHQTGVIMEGLGGNRSLRGVTRNRVIGDGFVLGNVELRYKLFDFRLLRQSIEVIPHIFFDAGRVVKFTKLNLENVPDADREKFFDIGAETFHSAAGAGVRLLINKNFVLTADFGKALSKKDGDGKLGIYVGANVLF